MKKHAGQADDAKLISNYRKNNDLNSLNTIFKKYDDRLFGAIFSRIGDTDLANDIKQDTYYRVINALKNDKYKEGGRFLNWIIVVAYRIMSNSFAKEQKLRKFIPNDKDFDIFSVLSDDDPNPEDILIEKEKFIYLENLVKGLSADPQEIIRMRLYEKKSFKEISEALNLNLSTARGRSRNALINLRKAIEEDRKNGVCVLR